MRMIYRTLPGLYYERENPEIWFGLENKQGWGKPLCEYLDSRANFYEDHTKIYSDDLCKENNGYWYKLKKEWFDKFNSQSSVEEQRIILRGFIDEIISLPLR